MKNKSTAANVYFTLGILSLIIGFFYGGTIVILLGALLVSVGFRYKNKNTTDKKTQ